MYIRFIGLLEITNVDLQIPTNGHAISQRNMAEPTQRSRNQSGFCSNTQGGFKSEVQHLQPCKVRRCKAPQDTTSNFSLKSA